MTIYKSQTKPEEKKDLVEAEFLPEVVVPVNGKVDLAASPEPQLPLPRRRKRGRGTVAVVSLVCLLFVACAVAGSVILYLKLRHKRYAGRCGVRFDPKHRQGLAVRGSEPHSTHKNKDGLVEFYEEVDIEVDFNREKIIAPKFDKNDKAMFLHDFTLNLTGIKDITDKVCYVVDMADSPVPHWKNLYERLLLMLAGFYQVDAGVIQREFTVVKPEVKDKETLGPFIAHECAEYPIFRLRKIHPVKPMRRRYREMYMVFPGGHHMHYYFINK